MNILITGGAGFIGSHLADRLLEKGENIVVIDNFDPYYHVEIKKRNISHNLRKKNYKFLEKDIADLQSLKKIISEENIDVIVHLAAKAGVRPSVEDPHSYSRVNIEGTLNILNATLNSTVDKIIFGSSSSVYGIPEYLPIDEQHPTKPVSPYGATKLAAEKMLFSYYHMYGVKSISLRFFTVYGPRQRPDMAIHKFTKLILQGTPIQAYGDGNSTRDYTYIDDIVDGLVSSIEKNTKDFEILNLGGGKRITLNELINLLEKYCGKKAKRNYVPEQRGDTPHTWADISKSKKILDYSPKTDVEEGVRIFIDWFKKVI